MRMVTMDPKKCVGCRNCEYACSNNRSGKCNSKESNIQVNYYPEEEACIPVTCMHCSEAWCLNVCPAGAISRDEKTNAVIINQDRCAGCKMCMLACPFGNIHFDKAKQVSRKCDLCGDKEPNCVAHCIAGALNFVDEEEVSKNRKRFDGLVIRTLEKGGDK